jgi:hypothetical protein
VFENRVLRRIFGPQRQKVAGGWRRLHNEELHDLYTSTNIIRMIRSRGWDVRHVARTGEIDTIFLVGKPEGKKRPLGRPRCRWEDIIRRNPTEVVWESGAYPWG